MIFQTPRKAPGSMGSVAKTESDISATHAYIVTPAERSSSCTTSWRSASGSSADWVPLCTCATERA